MVAPETVGGLHLLTEFATLVADMENTQLIDALAAIQIANGWSDQQMATTIGIDRRQWNMARRGRRGLGRRSLRGIAQAFPQLREAAMSCFFALDATQVERPVEKVAA